VCRTAYGVFLHTIPRHTGLQQHQTFLVADWNTATYQNLNAVTQTAFIMMTQ
jgi:hypothetical protein